MVLCHYIIWRIHDISFIVYQIFQIPFLIFLQIFQCSPILIIQIISILNNYKGLVKFLFYYLWVILSEIFFNNFSTDNFMKIN